MALTTPATPAAPPKPGTPRSGSSYPPSSPRHWRGPATRPARWGFWYAVEHRLLTMRAYLSSILVGSVFNPVMYLFALGVGIGSYIDGQSGGSPAGAGPGSDPMGGVAYLVFVGPALLASAAMTAAFEETSFPVMGGFKWSREFWAMNAAPLGGTQIALGVLLAAAIRIVFTVTVFWIFLGLFGALPAPTAILALPAAVLGGLAMGAVIMAVAAAIDEDDGMFAIINRMVIAPMFLFSGTFYPLDLMPPALQWIGWVSPLWHATELGRQAAFAQAAAPGMTLVHIAYLGLILVVGLGFSFHFFKRRLGK